MMAFWALQSIIWKNIYSICKNRVKTLIIFVLSLLLFMDLHKCMIYMYNINVHIIPALYTFLSRKRDFWKQKCFIFIILLILLTHLDRYTITSAVLMCIVLMMTMWILHGNYITLPCLCICLHVCGKCNIVMTRYFVWNRY